MCVCACCRWRVRWRVRISYGEIEGGFVHLGLVDLTGGVGQKCTLTPGSTSRDAVPAHRLWEKLKGSLLTASKDTLVGAGSTSGRDTEATPRGIVKGHAYAILQVLSNLGAYTNFTLGFLFISIGLDIYQF